MAELILYTLLIRWSKLKELLADFIKNMIQVYAVYKKLTSNIML